MPKDTKNVIMKCFILILTLIVSCSNDPNQKKLDQPKENLKVTKNRNKTCRPLDILMLKEKDVKTLFFQKLDSTVNKQYLGKKKESVDLTQELLEIFLNDLDTKFFSRNLIFQKKYKAKFVIEDKQSKNDSTTIELSYFQEDCFYRMAILNYYETEEYADESSVIYFFKIENKQITNFGRQEAG